MRYALIIIIMSLAGCVTPPSAEQINNADYGPYPEHYQNQITAFLYTLLKEPETAKLTYITPPQKNWFVNHAAGSSTNQFGYVVCVRINAKNSFGGYTGAKTYTFYFVNNQLAFYLPYGSNSGRPMCY